MPVLRVRFGLRVMMISIAVVAVLLSLGVDLVRRWRLVDFVSIRYIENEPLNNPTRVIAIDGARFVLEDGRVVLVDNGPDPFGMLSEDDLSLRMFLVEVETRADGSVGIYKKQPAWFCGTCLNSARPLIRIPIVTRSIPLNRKELIGAGRIVGGLQFSRATRDRRPAAR
jgi:hypothetical protein